MGGMSKVSPNFQSFLTKGGAGGKREAIVLYRSAAPAEPPVRGRLLDLKKRLDMVKAQAAAQATIQKKVFEDYRRSGGRTLKLTGDLEAHHIGSGALPASLMEVTRESLARLAALKDVVAVMPNQRVCLITPRSQDFDPISDEELNQGFTWGLTRLRVPELWDRTTGKDVRVAVLDTGVYGDHPALAGKVEKFIMVDHHGRRITAEPAFDGSDHGTHVCGTIAGGKTDKGVAIGVAPEAKLLAAAVLVGDAKLINLIEGLSWAAENGADIVSMSLSIEYYEPLFVEVFKNLIDLYDIVPVAAIGNSSHGTCESPGGAHNVLGVGAVARDGNGLAVANFSSGASLVFPGEAPGLVTKPDVTAPGVDVYSSVPPVNLETGTYQYAYMDGTSMATPHVAGVCALLRAARPEASAYDIIEVVKETARHPEGNGKRPDNRWGMGFVQPLAAYQKLMSNTG